MIDAGMILTELREIYNAGSTQQEIADRTGVSQSYVADLLSGKRSVDGLTLKKINQLFPQAILLLSGDTVSIRANRNSGNVVGVNHGTISQDCMSAIQSRILKEDGKMLAEQIREYLKALNDGRKTQEEMAKELHVAQSVVNRLLSGRKKFEYLSIGTFDRMFPEASIDLKGAALIHAPQNRGNVVGINNGHMAADCLSEVMDKILSTEELTAEEKIKVLKVLKK